MNDWPEFVKDDPPSYGELDNIEVPLHYAECESQARRFPCLLYDQDPPQRHPYLFLEKRARKFTPLQIVCRIVGWTLFALACFASVCICLGYGRGKT